MSDFKFSFKTIFLSMTITFFILMLFSGLLAAESNTRKTGFNEPIQYIVIKKSPPDISLTLNFLGYSYKLDFASLYKFTDNIYSAIYKFNRDNIVSQLQ